MKRISCSLLLLVTAAVSPLAAQSAAPKDNPPVARPDPDAEWQRVKDLGRPEYRGAPAGSPPAAHERAREVWATALLADAAKLRKFSADHPEHSQAKEAKRLEVLALLQAWRAGDATQATRREELVAELRKDASLPVHQRSEVAAFAGNIAVEKNHSPGAGRLAAYEQVARGLVAEFPELPDPYEALLYIARDSGDDRAPRLAADVAAMERAPAWVRSEAGAITTRYGLLGNSVVEPTRIIIAENNPFVAAEGRPLVIYTWSSTHPPSIARAKELAAKMPAGAAIIGVCLDQRDLEPAKALAKAESLPGEQIYDWLGRRGEIAEALGAIDPGLVFVADAEGIVRSVSAHRNLDAAIAALPAK